MVVLGGGAVSYERGTPVGFRAERQDRVFNVLIADGECAAPLLLRRGEGVWCEVEGVTPTQRTSCPMSFFPDEKCVTPPPPSARGDI